MISDFSLIEQTLEGDQSAFETLVNRHKTMAYNVALKIVGSEMEAEEVAMDAFVKAYRNLKKFNKESKFTTWFYRIITNQALSLKRRKKLDTIDLENAATESDRSSDKVLQKENERLIRRALSDLSDKDETLLTLFYLKELTLDEISEIVELTVNNVKVGVHRARKRLAETLKAQLGDEVYELVKE